VSETKKRPAGPCRALCFHMSLRNLLTDIHKGVAQRCRGKVDQPPERVVELEHHEERGCGRQRADEQDDNGRLIAGREKPEDEEDDHEPEH